MRIYDAELVHKASSFFLKSEHLVDAIEWVANPDNILLTNDRGDLALFEKGIKNTYSGHYFFKSRGKAALIAATEFLDEIFNTCYNIPVMMGMVPLDNLGARWLTRKLGFKSYGTIEHYNKTYEMFIMSKKDFNK